MQAAPAQFKGEQKFTANNVVETSVLHGREVSKTESYSEIIHQGGKREAEIVHRHTVSYQITEKVKENRTLS